LVKISHFVRDDSSFRLSFRARREKSFFDLEYDVFKLNHYHAAASIDIDT